MPYKDQERKRQWEREHREQRNARRRELRLTTQPILTRKLRPTRFQTNRPQVDGRYLLVWRSGWGSLYLPPSEG
jgi:hypothetical protein